MHWYVQEFLMVRNITTSSTNVLDILNAKKDVYDIVNRFSIFHIDQLRSSLDEHNCLSSMPPNHQLSYEAKYGSLETWLYEQKLDYYPTVVEKVMLCVESGLTIHEINSWLVTRRDQIWKEMIHDMDLISLPIPPVSVFDSPMESSTPPSPFSFLDSPVATLTPPSPFVNSNSSTPSSNRSFSFSNSTVKSSTPVFIKSPASFLDSPKKSGNDHCISMSNKENQAPKLVQTNDKFKTPARIKRKCPDIPMAPRKRYFIEAKPIHQPDSLVRKFLFEENWFDELC